LVVIAGISLQAPAGVSLAQEDNMVHAGPSILLSTIFRASANAAAAQAPQSWTQVGGLSCQVDPNVGFIIVGHQSMRCLFTPNAPIPQEAYAGAISTVGVNVGISAGGVLGWAVFAPTSGLPLGALVTRLSTSLPMSCPCWVLLRTQQFAPHEGCLGLPFQRPRCERKRPFPSPRVG